MAKVIKLEDQLKNKKCSSCKAVIGYTPDEIVEVQEPVSRNGTLGTWKTLKCPNCNYVMKWLK